MRTVTQRVQHASVTIDGQLKSKIGKGLLVLVGIEDKDTQEDIEWLAKKITNYAYLTMKRGHERSVIEAGARSWLSANLPYTPLRKKGTAPPT